MTSVDTETLESLKYTSPLSKMNIMDPLAFVIQESTFILSAMRKDNKSNSNPFAAILLNQFLNDTSSNSTSYDEESLNLSSIPNRLKDNNNSNTHHKSINNLNTNNNNNKSFKSKDDDHFISGFVELRSILSQTNDISLIDIITLLQPFLVVIKSPSTSCYITDLAVSSLYKFFNYNIVNKDQSNIVQALSQIVSTLAHCRFEGADQTHDDLLLVKIIQLLEYLVTSDLNNYLTNDSMYEIVSTCFSLAINTRRRDMLRSSAENSLLKITEILFSKLKILESKPEIDHNTKSAAQLEFNNESLHVDTIGRSTPTPSDSQLNDVNEQSNDKKSLNETIEKEPETSVEEEKKDDQEEDNESNVNEIIDQTSESSDELPLSNINDDNTDLSPYGIPCMREFLNHTVDILLPENRYRFTESTRILSLEILIRIIEVTGIHLTKHSQLFSLFADNCCHHIVQIIQNNESTALVNLSMRLFLDFSINYPNHLKVQLELMLTTIINSIISDENIINDELNKFNDSVFEMSKKGKFETNSVTEYEITDLKKKFENGINIQTKEFLIEALSVLWCRSPYLFINLFKSYDCDLERVDLSNKLIKLLCRLSYSDVSLLITSNVPPICLDGVLSFVNGIYDRIKIGMVENVNLDAYTKNNLLIQQYNKKSDFISSVQKWNEKPEKGLIALHEKGFLNDPNDDKEVALFLFTNSGRIDKKKLGELLAKPTKLNLLKEFVGLLDFKNLRPDESLRILLNYFRLPGEAQQIDRIISTFNDRYIQCQDSNDEADEQPKSNGDGDEEEEEKVLPDADAMFVLSFSLIMLNTDLHNPNIKKPMTLEDYQRNLRGCYRGKNFPVWYTEKMYNSIKEKEIIMPEEHKGTAKWFENVWHSLIAEQESKKANELNNSIFDELWTTENGCDIGELLSFDKILFQNNYKNLLSTLVVMFDDATNDSVITKMMSTIEKCAAIAIYFGLEEIVDSIIEITAHLSTLTGVKKSEFANESRDILPLIEINDENDKLKSIYVCDLTILFGRDYRAQLSMIVLFRVLKRYNYKVTKGWYYSIKAILKLFEVGLIDPNIFIDFQKSLNFESLKKSEPEYKLNKSDVFKDNGLFSTFSSYLKVLSAETLEPTHEEIEISIYAIDFVKTLNINNLFLNVLRNTSDTDSMNKLVQILVALLPNKNDQTNRYYVDEVLLLLESIVNYLVVSKNQKLIHQVINKCDSLIENDTSEMKMSTVCRILSYKLILINEGLVKNENNIKLLHSTFNKITSFTTSSRESFIKHGFSILIPLEKLILNEDNWCCKEVIYDSQYWIILRTIASLPKNTNYVFQFISKIVKEHSKLINYNNYMDILGLLDEISAVGAYGAQWEHEYDKLVDSGHKVENKQNPYQELVNIGLNSITLTSELSDVILNNKSFQESINERNEKGQEVVSPWYPLIEAISHQCYNPCRQLRNHALNTLSNLLISNKSIPINELSLDKIIDASCLRLLIELMKPEVNGTDVKGMIKTQRDVIGLACKIILNHDEIKKLGNIIEKIFALTGQLIQKNRNIYPNSGHEDEIIEMLRNLLMIRSADIDLVTLKGYKMDSALKKVVEQVIQETKNQEKPTGEPEPKE